MVGFASAAIVFIFGAFLLGVGTLMMFRPRAALTALRYMGSTKAVHFSELSLRFLAGLGVYGFAVQSPHMQAFHIVGIFLMVTSLLIMCVPNKLHNAYALWWANRFPPMLICALGLLPIAIGAWLLKTALTSFYI